MPIQPGDNTSILPIKTGLTGLEYHRVLGEDGKEYKSTAQEVSKILRRVSPQKKLIHVGGAYTIDTLKTNIPRFEKYGFDGMVVEALYTDDFYGASTNFSWRAGGSPAPIKRSLLATPISDAQATPFQRFTHNFLRLNLCTYTSSLPAGYDVFNARQVDGVCANHETAAWMVAQSGYVGIHLDVEQYNSSKLLNPNYKLSTRTYQQYLDQWKVVGKRIMTGYLRQKADMVLVVTLGHTQVKNTDDTTIQTNNYGFLPGFLDGLYDACAGQAQIVVMDELSYEHQADADFDADIVLQETNVPRLTSKNYNRVHVTGLATWLDSDHSGAQAFDYNTPANSYHTPTIMRANLGKIWARCDWAFMFQTSNTKWDGGTAGSNAVPLGSSGYDTAVKNARIDIGIEVAFDIKLFRDILFGWDPVNSGLSNAAVISTLTDISGLGNHFTGINSPVFSNNALGTGFKGAVLTAASTMYFRHATFGANWSGGSKALTVIAQLLATSSAPAGRQTIFSTGKSDSATPYRDVALSTSRWTYDRKGDSGSNASVNSDTFINGSPLCTSNHIWTCRSSDALTEHRINGTIVHPASAHTTTGNPTQDVAAIGAKYGNATASTPLDGAIGHIYIFNRLLEDQEILAIERMIASTNSSLVTGTSLL